MKYLVLLAVFAMGSVLSLHVDDGCEAMPEWKLDYKWDEIKIGFWVPPEESSVVLSIDVEFERQILPVTYDNFEINRKEINFTRIREGDRKSTTFKIFDELVDGWNYFKFTLNTQYGLKDMFNNSISSLNSSVDYLPKSLSISGSNITVNCESNLRMWKIANDPVIIPLDAAESAESHRLSFYSSREFLPELVLEMREFPLGWWSDGKILTTIPARAKPLPPFVLHHLMITCRQEIEIICSTEVLNGTFRIPAEEHRVANIPKSVAIKRKDSSPFSVFLHNRDPLPVITQEESNLETCRYNVAKTLVGIFAGIASLLLVILLGLGLFTYGKLIKSCVEKLLNIKNARQNDVENNDNASKDTSDRFAQSGCEEAFIK